MPKTLSILLLFLLSFGSAHAQGADELTMGRRINLAARQRMLSQRMAKDYVYLWRKVNEAEAQAQLTETINAFEATLKLFHDNPLSSDVQYKLTDVHTAWTGYKKVLTDPALPIDIAPFMAQASSMLLVTDALVKEIEKYARAQPGFNVDAKVDSRRSIVNVLGRQRMLSQRITACYAAYEANPGNAALKTTLLEAIKFMQDDWAAIQQFITADPEGFAAVASTPEFREMVVQRKAFEDVLDGMKQNKRTELTVLWPTTNSLVAVLDKVVMQSETMVGKP